jgi:hypothetical protein
MPEAVGTTAPIAHAGNALLNEARSGSGPALWGFDGVAGGKDRNFEAERPETTDACTATRDGRRGRQPRPLG